MRKHVHPQAKSAVYQGTQWAAKRRTNPTRESLGTMLQPETIASRFNDDSTAPSRTNNTTNQSSGSCTQQPWAGRFGSNNARQAW